MAGFISAGQSINRQNLRMRTSARRKAIKPRSTHVVPFEGTQDRERKRLGEIKSTRSQYGMVAVKVTAIICIVLIAAFVGYSIYDALFIQL